MTNVLREKARELYVDLRTKSPRAGYYAHRFYKRRYINRISKRIRGRANKINYDFTTVLASVRFDIVGDRNVIEILEGCVLEDTTFFIRGNNHRISIGRECSFGKGSVIWFEDRNGLLSVGDGTGFGRVHIAVTEPNSKVEIGKDCMFSSDIDVRTGDSHSIVDLESGARMNFAKDVEVCDHVWVGAHSLILKGVTVREHSVVATGSVLTKSVDEANVLIAGNPATIVRRQIDWLRARI